MMRDPIIRAIPWPRPKAGRWLVALLACWTAAATTLAWAALPIEHWTTSQGAQVLFVRAPSIPMLDLNIDFDAGGRYDPGDRIGLASMTNALMFRGADGLDEEAIAEGFAMRGTVRGGGAGDDRASLSLRTLTSEAELDESLALFARVIATPTFPQAIVAREKDRVIHSIRESLTKPEVIAQRAFGEALYRDHPYGAHATPRSVAAIGRDDLLAFHRDRYGASRAVISMIGAIPRAQAARIAERIAAALPAGVAPPAMPEVPVPTGATVRRIAHPASQSHILIGLPAIARADPDFFPLLVGNYVLGGGGFVSRLYNEVREKRGLAYSVYSYFSPQRQAGPFTVGLQTERSQTELALRVVRDTLDSYLAQGPTEAELAAAKSNLISGFPLRIDSNRKILDNLANIGFHGLPIDYLDTWTARVAAVGREDILRAFARHVRTDRLSTIVVGGDAPAK